MNTVEENTTFNQVSALEVQRTDCSKQFNGTDLILVDAVFFQIAPTGIARLWKTVLEQWVVSGFAEHVIVLDRQGTAPKIPGIKYRSIPLYNYEQTDSDRQMLQYVCDQEQASLFISTYYTTPITTPSVFMAYDMIPEVVGTDLEQPMWREKHNGIRHASHYLSISENTARDLSQYFSHIAPDALTVAHCGVDSIFTPASTKKITEFKQQYGIEKPYFLLVGGRMGYKNALLFFKAFAQLKDKNDFSIVCVSHRPVLEEEFQPYVVGLEVHTISLSDDELSVAYSGATSLVYPSWYEGFGLPIAEAMACGCPVITCNVSSIPEVSGEAALYIQRDSVEDLVFALAQVQDSSIRQNLISKGFEQVRQFSWIKMANIIATTLTNECLIQSFQLRQVNFIAFPDWQQAEEDLFAELLDLLRSVVLYGNRQQTTLLIYIGDHDESDADMAISSVMMHLVLEEGIEIDEDGAEIILVRSMSSDQWKHLSSRLSAQLILESGNEKVNDTLQKSTQSTVEQILVSQLSRAHDLKLVNEDQFKPIKDKSLIKLHLGCGRNLKEGYVNVDQYVSAPNILQADIFALPFNDNTIDEIFTEHMLEHLSKFEVSLALKEWARVLKHDGKLLMNLPNLEWCLQQWLDKSESERWGWQLDTIFGLQTHPGEFHKTGFTKPRLQELLTHAGFQTIQIEDLWSHEQGCFWIEASRLEERNTQSSTSDQSNQEESISSIFDALVNCPRIEPLPHNENRPFWSVILPVYNPKSDYLTQSLEGLLQQAPSEAEMQIEVIDDCSTDLDVESIVREVGKGRIKFHRNSKNLGLLPNWNYCLQRAKGQWIHLLHQDDIILPGFYGKMKAAIANQPNLGAAFCRHFYINAESDTTGLSLLERETPGILEDWLEKIVICQRIQFVSIVVQRKTYETLGGYYAGAGSAADWEMWRRIAVQYPIWYEPEPLACFRNHALSESSRLIQRGENISDIRQSIDLVASYLPSSISPVLTRQAKENYAYAALNLAEGMLRDGNVQSAIALLREGLKCSQSTEVQSRLVSLLLSTANAEIDATTVLQDHNISVWFESLKLREINFLTFPDWQQPEESLFLTLADLFRTVLTYRDRAKASILIYLSNYDEAEADMAISSVLMHLMIEEGIEIDEDGAEIVLVSATASELSQEHWRSLFPHISARIILNSEHQQAIEETGATDLSPRALNDFPMAVMAQIC